MASMNRRPYATRKVSKEEYEEDLKRREESAERAKEWVAKKFANPLDELTAKWEKCEKENNGHIYGVVGDEEGLLRKRKMVRVRCVACNYQYLAEPETTQKLPEFWDELGRWSGLQGLSIACRAIRMTSTRRRRDRRQPMSSRETTSSSRRRTSGEAIAKRTRKAAGIIDTMKI